MANEIVTPIIHLNGDTKASLMEALENAYDAVANALKALQACAPNGRNYYPEPGRLLRATTQHQARYDHLYAVKRSLMEEALAIQDQYPSHR